MTYLIVKMLFLLLLSAIGGGLFTYWWIRRRSQDVTADFAQAQSDNLVLESEVSRLKQNFRALEDVPAQLLSIAERVEAFPASVDAAIDEKRLPTPEQIDVVPAVSTSDVAPVKDSGVSLESIIDAINGLQIPASEPADVSPLLERIDIIEEKLDLLISDTKRIKQASLVAEEDPI